MHEAEYSQALEIRAAYEFCSKKISKQRGRQIKIFSFSSPTGGETFVLKGTE